MSKHILQIAGKNNPLQVTAGWDPRLHGYFLDIIDMREVEGRFIHNMLYTSMCEKESHPKNLSAFKPVLQKHGISLPAPMVTELMSDAVENVGNRTVLHAMNAGIYRREQMC